MLDEEVADITQVHCDCELFEIELSTSPSCVNVKGNVRRSVEFWKCIGTPSFIFDITEWKWDICFLPLVSRNQWF